MKHNRIVKKMKRHGRIRMKISGTAQRPRMTIFRSNYGLYVQLIDDIAGKTLLGIRSDKKNVGAAKTLGLEIAERAKALKITSIVFDRSGYKYHGTVKSLSDAAREGGLQF